MQQTEMELATTMYKSVAISTAKISGSKDFEMKGIILPIVSWNIQAIKKIAFCAYLVF